MTTRHPVAYLRRSSADADSPGDVSRAIQEDAIFALAERDGYTAADVHVYTDWARSASEEKSDRRTQYAAMLRDIEAGKVSHVYAYALDRLNRSLLLSARFAKACEAGKVAIVTHREGEVRQDTSDEWLRWTILATFGEYELRTIKTRAASALVKRRARGDKLGRAAYGYTLVKQDGRFVEVRDESVDLEPIVTAYRDAGTVLGACRLLEERGIAAPAGGDRWATSALTRIIEREWPGLLPRRTKAGVRRATSALLAQLLECPFCGRMLTPNTHRGQYYCANGPRQRAKHPRYAVREVDVLPWVVAEAARWRAPGTHAQEAPNSETARARIVEARRKLALTFARGALDDATYEAEDATLAAELADLDRGGIVVPIMDIDWTWAPADINAILREMWRSIELGPDLLPVRADWRVQPG